MPRFFYTLFQGCSCFLTTSPASAIIFYAIVNNGNDVRKTQNGQLLSLPAVLKGDFILKTGLLVAADLYGCAEDALEQNALKHSLEEYAEANHMHMQSIR